MSDRIFPENVTSVLDTAGKNPGHEFHDNNDP